MLHLVHLLSAGGATWYCGDRISVVIGMTIRCAIWGA